MKINYLLFCALMMSFGMAQAGDRPRSVDVGKFDIAGIKLGMSTTEAVNEISNKLKIDKHAIQFDKFPKLNHITNTKEPQYFTAKTESTKVIVYLLPKVPYDKANPMLVSSVEFEMPSTPENEQSMKSAAFKKYGQPSASVKGGGSYWCKWPGINHMNTNFCAQTKGPQLNLVGARLAIYDHAYGDAVTDFLDKTQSGKPPGF